MTPTPANLPKPKPTHVRNARTASGERIAYQTTSALRAAVSESVAPTAARMVTSPKAIRVTPTPVVNPVRVIASPVTVRQADPATIAAARERMAARKNPFSS